MLYARYKVRSDAVRPCEVNGKLLEDFNERSYLPTSYKDQHCSETKLATISTSEL
jgi:hypothetical protein